MQVQTDVYQRKNNWVQGTRSLMGWTAICKALTAEKAKAEKARKKAEARSALRGRRPKL